MRNADANYLQLTAKHDDLRTKHALALPTSESSHKRDKTSSSTLSVHSTESEKSIAGFQKIVAELSDENGDLKQKIQDLEREIQTLLADNHQLAEECSVLRHVSCSLVAWKTISDHRVASLHALQSLAELEAAVEDKLAKEEQQLNSDERDVQIAASKAADDRLQTVSISTTSRK